MQTNDRKNLLGGDSKMLVTNTTVDDKTEHIALHYITKLFIVA